MKSSSTLSWRDGTAAFTVFKKVLISEHQRVNYLKTGWKKLLLIRERQRQKSIPVWTVPSGREVRVMEGFSNLSQIESNWSVWVTHTGSQAKSCSKDWQTINLACVSRCHCRQTLTAIILKLMEPWRKNAMYVFVCMGVGASDGPKQFRIRKRKRSS